MTDLADKTGTANSGNVYMLIHDRLPLRTADVNTTFTTKLHILILNRHEH